MEDNLAGFQSSELKQTGDIGRRAASETTEGIRRGLLSNTEMSEPLMQGSFGADNPGIAGAIKQRYSRKFGIQDREFQMQMDMMADQAKFDRLSKAAGLVNQELQLNEEKRRIKRAKQLAKRQQRGAILGQVLGIGGAVAGGLIAGPMGGATGAMIGYQAGSGVGNALGSM